VTFRAYSKDQISDIVKHRLKVAIGLLHVLSIQVSIYAFVSSYYVFIFLFMVSCYDTRIGS
jgi:Cdc6-like AAA superfamily ATPase